MRICNMSIISRAGKISPGSYRIILALCIGLLGASPFSVLAQAGRNACGELGNAYGPYDYRSDRDKLPIVEIAHFTPEVEALIRGLSGHIGGDIDYTLRAFPNHHRALLTMMRLGERMKTVQPPAAKYTIDCYFQRAVRFKPDDTTTRMLFANYLHKNGRSAEANQQMEQTLALAGENPFTHYNAGLVYLDLKNYEKALHQAHTAYALGFTRPELREALKKAGKWVEPPAEAASMPAAIPAAPAQSDTPDATKSSDLPAR